MSSARTPRQLRSEQALARLVPAGEASVEALEKALAADPESALAVAERLGAIASGDAVRVLERMESGADKELRREIRRALYRLRQKGVAAKESERPSAPVRAVLGGPDLEGFLSFGDPLGDRLLWILKPRPGGGLLHFSAIVNEPAGLKEAVLAEVTRKAVKTLRGELERRHGLRLVDVDWRYADWIASEGYERARARGEVPGSAAHFAQLRLQLTTAPAVPISLPVPGGTAEDLAASAGLLEEPEMQHWFLPETVLSADLARYREVRDSPILLDRGAQLARVEEIVQGAVDGVFAGERAASWKRRFEEAAYVFARSGRPPAAARAAAVADAVASRGGGRGIPLCEELVRRSFGMFFAEEAEREREEKASSVLITPDDLRAARAQRGRGPRRP